MEPIKRYSALTLSSDSRQLTQPKNSTDRCSNEVATAQSALLLGCFPDFKNLDPVFAARLTDLFMDYPADVVAEVVLDLPLRVRGPNLLDVTEALDAAVYERECERARQIQAERDREQAEDQRRRSAAAAQARSDEAAAEEAKLAAMGETERAEYLAYKSRNLVQEMRADREYERRTEARRSWKYDPAKAHHYPLEWLMLTKEERWELAAKGLAPIAEGPDNDQQALWRTILGAK